MYNQHYSAFNFVLNEIVHIPSPSAYRMSLFQHTYQISINPIRICFILNKFQYDDKCDLIMFNVGNQRKQHDTALHTLPYSNFVMIGKENTTFSASY